MVASPPEHFGWIFPYKNGHARPVQFLLRPRVVRQQQTPQKWHIDHFFPPLSPLYSSPSRPINLSHLGVFPFVTAASIHDGLPSFFPKMCHVEKKSQNNGSRCVLLLLCVKRGTACGFLKCWVCRNTHKLKRWSREVCTCRSWYKTLLRRNCCTLAVYNKTAFEIGSGQIGMLAGFPETGKEKWLVGQK